MDDVLCPLPYENFKKFAEYQSNALLNETDLFLKNHNLRLRKYLLPVKLPDWASSFDEVLDSGQEYEPLTSIYRHKHFLKCRVLHNYSYIETRWNRGNDPRNKNIPFDLRPLTHEIINQLDIINEDILDPEFSGLLVTLNTNTYSRPSVNKSPKFEKINGDGSTGGDWGGESAEKNVESEEKNQGKISKVIAGALVECLITNERCIKSIWVHPDLTKHSSRILLQSFLPRLMYEIFMVPSVMTDKGVSKYNKFTYCMHNDLDLFPRQCWLLFASNKKMSLPRHYEPSTFEEHPVQLEYGDCHTDEVGYLQKYRSCIEVTRERREGDRRSERMTGERGRKPGRPRTRKVKEPEEVTVTDVSLTENEDKDESNKEDRHESNKEDRDEEVNKEQSMLYREMEENNDFEVLKKEDEVKEDDKLVNGVDLVVNEDKHQETTHHEQDQHNDNEQAQEEEKDESKVKSDESDVSDQTQKDESDDEEREKRKHEEMNGITPGYGQSQDSEYVAEKPRKRGRKSKLGGLVDMVKNGLRRSSRVGDTKNEPPNLKKEPGNDEQDKENAQENAEQKREKRDMRRGLNRLKELFSMVGSVISTRNVACTCRREKLKKTIDDQAWLDRLVGCTENYMYLMLPKKAERARLGLMVREGWRDLVTVHEDHVLLNDINNILPEFVRERRNSFKSGGVNYNSDADEWCRLKREDLIDVTSDTEVYMRLPDNCSS